MRRDLAEPLKKPMTGIAGCCARAASGQAAAEPTIPLMKLRRRIAFPKAQDHANYAITAGICDTRNGVQWSVCTAAILSRHVRFGSWADIVAAIANVRFTPENGRR